MLASLASQPLAAFPVFRAGRLPHHSFRGLLGVHFALQPAWSLSRPGRPFVVGVLHPMSLPPSFAPTATGWSDSCRAGFAPAEEWRLVTAHRNAPVIGPKGRFRSHQSGDLSRARRRSLAHTVTTSFTYVRRLRMTSERLPRMTAMTGASTSIAPSSVVRDPSRSRENDTATAQNVELPTSVACTKRKPLRGVMRSATSRPARRKVNSASALINSERSSQSSNVTSTPTAIGPRATEAISTPCAPAAVGNATHTPSQTATTARALRRCRAAGLVRSFQRLFGKHCATLKLTAATTTRTWSAHSMLQIVIDVPAAIMGPRGPARPRATRPGPPGTCGRPGRPPAARRARKRRCRFRRR